MAKEPEWQSEWWWWRAVSARVLRKIHDGQLVLPSAELIPQNEGKLLPGSVVLVPPKELLKHAAQELAQARGQHERAVWQQVIERLPSGRDGKWGYCRFCEEPYELPRVGARRDLCAKPKCRREADAKRNYEKYHSSPAVREKKKAGARARKVAVQKKLATKAS